MQPAGFVPGGDIQALNAINNAINPGRTPGTAYITPPAAPTGGGGGGGDAGVAQAQAYAAAQERARIGNITNSINRQKDTVVGAGNQAFGAAYNQYDQGARGLVNTIRQGQQTITRGRETTALNKLRSMGDLATSVRQGLQSGSVRLANSNALDSSAAEAMSRAYGNFQNKQSGSINNQAALENRGFDDQQALLFAQRDDTLRGLRQYKETESQRIMLDTQQKLQALEDNASGQGVAGLVQIDALKNQVVNQGVSDSPRLIVTLMNSLAAFEPQMQMKFRRVLISLIRRALQHRIQCSIRWLPTYSNEAKAQTFLSFQC